MRVVGRDLIRGGHYGQRSCEPHSKAEHMAAPTNAAKREKSSCQLGAVHTWHKTDLNRCPLSVAHGGHSGRSAVTPVCPKRILNCTFVITSGRRPGPIPRPRAPASQRAASPG